ncbi:MAG: chromate resistance protein [Chloroflexi bacterium]|nr:MAG: chromate resistance protein [Chloroflexota bacterium]
MKWATRAGCHIDRVACAWVITRFIDCDAEFVFVNDPDEITEGATAFDIRGVALSHHEGRCTFETIILHYELVDPALEQIAKIVHEADLADDVYDAPEAAGVDILIRGLSMVRTDDEMLALTGPLFDGLYEYFKRSNMLAGA